MDSKESFHKLFQNLVNVIRLSVAMMFGLWKMFHWRENKVGDVFALNNLVVSTDVTTLTPTALFTDHVSSRLLVIKPLLLRSVVLVSFPHFFGKDESLSLPPFSVVISPSLCSVVVGCFASLSIKRASNLFPPYPSLTANQVRGRS